MKRSLKILFFGIYIIFAACAFVLITNRGKFAFVPQIVTGTLPNFVPVAFCPLLTLFSQKTRSLWDLYKLAFSMFFAMCTYEVAQIWMPHRTFDWADIVASALGLFVALVVFRVQFFLSSENCRFIATNIASGDPK